MVYLPDDVDDKQGPFTTAQLKVVQGEQIHAKTYVWNEDLPAWEVGKLPDLRRSSSRDPRLPSRRKSRRPGSLKVGWRRVEVSAAKSVKRSVRRESSRTRGSLRVRESNKQFAEGWNGVAPWTACRTTTTQSTRTFRGKSPML